jgi:D-alanyl-lipoteichoic acid acyltransferase DltB (MBOAT superfamily)
MRNAPQYCRLAAQMLFNSVHFLLFFPVVAGCYFLLPARLRLPWLLAASYYFYMAWRPAYVLVIWAITGIDYAAGLLIARAPAGAWKRAALLLSICSNLTLLFFFKYFEFFAVTVQTLLGFLDVAWQPPLLDVVLPLGVSFHTFQALSYTIDVYRGRKDAERNFRRFALFIAFFPQLVAGPIERATHLLPQLRYTHDFDRDRVVQGLQQMLWGFFKKLVVADRLADYVQPVYERPDTHNPSQLLLATYFFAYQIYCDFSGYSDIAIGAARVLGYELTINFERPYAAASVREFWHRWHISLSTWFRDYLYIPLGGNRVPTLRHVVNLSMVFLLSGLWHGANWTFVVWGGLHGCYVVASILTSSLRERVATIVGLGRHPRARRVLGTLVTFHLVLFAWVFFRAETLATASRVITRVATELRVGQPLLLDGFGTVAMLLALTAVVSLEVVERVQLANAIGPRLAKRPAWLRWACYYGAVLVILWFGRFEEREFIYFQF